MKKLNKEKVINCMDESNNTTVIKLLPWRILKVIFICIQIIAELLRPCLDWPSGANTLHQTLLGSVFCEEIV